MSRKVVDARDLASDQLVYFKGHAKATYLNSGSTVEDEITYINQEVDKKQDNLVSGTNIKTINNQNILGSGNINIEGETLTESDISAMGFTKNTGTYSKPSTGIPKSDLASDVQTSLSKANTALQSYTEQYKGTITGITMNGVSKGTSGVVNLGTVITVHQDISGKQDKLVSGTNIKTINGTSLLGSGNIVISGGGGDSGGSGAYSEVSHGTSDTTFALTPNTFHVWDEVSNLTLTLGDETAGVANEFLFQFNSGSTATTLTLPDTLKWANDSAPTIEANKIYQISILKGLASVLVFKNTGDLIENRLSIMSQEMGMSTFTFEYPVASDVTIQYTNAFGGNGTSIIENGTQLTETEFEPGNENIVSVVISPISDNTYIYTT